MEPIRNKNINKWSPSGYTQKISPILGRGYLEEYKIKTI